MTSTGLYSWQLYIRSNFSTGNPIDRAFSGTAYVVVRDNNNPIGPGWSVAGVNQLVGVSGGVLWVYGLGGSRFFASAGGNNFTSPANDFGTLVLNLDNTYTYTAKDQTKINFSSIGLQTSIVDPHNLALTYTYSGSLLSTVTAPDGGITTFTYSGGLLATIAEPGARTVTLTHNGTNDLTGITDVDGSLRTLTYDSGHRLTNDKWNPLNATYTYDTTAGAGALLSGALKSIDRGLGTSLQLVPQAVQGLNTAPAKLSSGSIAVLTDALSQLTTFTLDGTARLTKLQTPDGGTQTWVRDSAGQATVYTDPINRVTTYTFQYGTGQGDLTQITYPDGSTNLFQYDGTYHHLTQYQDTLGHLTTFTYGVQGDLVKVQDALNEVTTLVWSSGLLQSQTDPLNHTTTFQYDTARRLQTIIDALNQRTTATYDAAGNPRTVQDPLGRVTTVTFDGRNRLTNIVDALGGVQTLTYNAIGELTSYTDALGRVTQNTYDQRGWRSNQTQGYGSSTPMATGNGFDYLGRQTTITDANNHVTTLTYDAVGQLRTRTSPVGGVETLTYDLAGQVLTDTDPLNHTTTFTYDLRGRVTQVKDPLNLLTTAVYDTEGNPLATVDARGNRTTLAYDVLNRLVQSTDPLGNRSTIVYDPAGNVQALVDARGNRTTMSYDALYRPIATTDPLGHTATSVYDAVGNVVQAIDPGGFATTLTYDALNRLIRMQDPGGGVATTVYDAVGNVVNTIDPLGNKSTLTYDSLNRLTQSTDPRGAVITTVYDSVGNVLNVVDPVGNKTTFVYDAADRLVQQTDPLGHNSTYAYDLANRLTSTTDRLGRRRDLAYDNDDRLTTESWIANGGGSAGTLTYSYDNNGNLLTAANANGIDTMTYDALDRVSTTQEPFGLTLTATYDAVGNRTLLQDNFGGVLTSVYDEADRLTSRQFGGTGQTPLRIDLTYTSRDQVQTVSRYKDLAGTQLVGASAYTYDSDGRLTNLQHKDGSSNFLANYTYTYDLASRLTTEKLNGTTTTYSYDAANELTSDTAHAYSYDLNGNRNAAGYTTGPGNQLTNDGTWTYTYDAEGNLTKKSKGASAETWTYGYDHWNHLVWAKDQATDGGTVLTLATYVYDALGDRIEKDVWTQASGTTTVTRFGYDGPNIWVDLNGSNQLQTRRLYLDGVDNLFARVSSTGTAAWYLTDRLGSVRDIANNTTGAVIDHLDDDGFGNATETQPANGDRYRWTGREFDTETGLQYNRARYYNPTNGRWQSIDPLGFRAGDSNLYRYAQNNATNFADPSGLELPGPGYNIVPNTPMHPPVQIGGPYKAYLGNAGYPLTPGQMNTLRQTFYQASVKIHKAYYALYYNFMDEMDPSNRLGGDDPRYASTQEYILQYRPFLLEQLRTIYDKLQDPGTNIGLWYQSGGAISGSSGEERLWTNYYPLAGYLNWWSGYLNVADRFLKSPGASDVYHELARYYLLREDSGIHNITQWDELIQFLNYLYDRHERIGAVR